MPICTKTPRTGRPKLKMPERFWKFVKFIWAYDACWEWQGSTRKGYGRFEYFDENYAHRVAWILVRGPIPEGMRVLHHCDNPNCVRPHHLFLGTLVDNSQDCIAKGRKPDLTGELNPMAKLTWTQVSEVRRRIANGEKQSEVADSMGILRTLVGKIWHNQVWRDANRPQHVVS